jgi:hypothetical protein
MATYIKANKKVAEFLGLTVERNQLPDGNYLLWQADMLKFGPLTRLSATLEEIGGVALTSNEARREQDGDTAVELPAATDERFYIAPPVVEPEPEPEPTEGESEEEDEATIEAPADEAAPEETDEAAPIAEENTDIPEEEEESHE